MTYDILAGLGAIWVAIFLVWPILEALIFGFCMVILNLLNLDRKIRLLSPRIWWACVRVFWNKSFSRLLGNYASADSCQIGNWEYEPPFRFRRTS